MTTSSLLQGFDREPIPITSAAKLVAPRSIVPSTFNFTECPLESCSLDNDMLNTLHASRPEWPALSALEVKRFACRLSCALQAKGNWSLIDDSWQSLLLQPGSLCKREKKQGIYLVFATSPHAFLGWRVAVAKKPGSSFGISIPAASKSSMICRAVTDHSEWKCIALEPIAPTVPAETSGATGGFGVEAKGVSVPLLSYSAAHGFHGLQITHLRLLFQDKAFGEMPTCEEPPRIEAQFVEKML